MNDEIQDKYMLVEDTMFKAIEQVATIVNKNLPPEVLSSYAGVVAPSVTKATFLLLTYVRTHIEASTKIESHQALEELTTALATMALEFSTKLDTAKEFAKQQAESH